MPTPIPTQLTHQDSTIIGESKAPFSQCSAVIQIAQAAQVPALANAQAVLIQGRQSKTENVSVMSAATITT
jgi:hypothetical protein